MFGLVIVYINIDINIDIDVSESQRRLTVTDDSVGMRTMEHGLTTSRKVISVQSDIALVPHCLEEKGDSPVSMWSLFNSD